MFFDNKIEIDIHDMWRLTQITMNDLNDRTTGLENLCIEMTKRYNQLCASHVELIEAYNKSQDDLNVAMYSIQDLQKRFIKGY